MSGRKGVCTLVEMHGTTEGSAGQPELSHRATLHTDVGHLFIHVFVVSHKKTKNRKYFIF